MALENKKNIKQHLAPLIKAKGLKVVLEDNSLIDFKTRFNEIVRLPDELYTKNELFEILSWNQKFQEFLDKSPSDKELFQKIFSQYTEPLKGHEEKTTTFDEPDIEKKERARLQKIKNDGLEQDLEYLKLSNARLKQETELRSEYANKIFQLIRWWLAFLAILTTLNTAFRDWVLLFLKNSSETIIKDIGLSDTLLMFLWGTATTTVIGLFVYVAKHLFPAIKIENPKKNK